MAQSNAPDSLQVPESVDVVIKNPLRTTSEDFKILLPLSATVAEVKNVLMEKYPGNPPVSRQTLIHAGKVLKDDQAKLKDILKQAYNPDVPYTLHLVVKSATEAPPAPPSRSVPVPTPTETIPPSSTTESNTQSQPGPSSFNQFVQPNAFSANILFPGAPRPSVSAEVPAFPQGYSFSTYPNPYLYGSPALAAMYSAAYATLRCANGPPGQPGTAGDPVASAPPSVFAYFPIVAPQPAIILPVSLLQYGPTQQAQDHERQPVQFAPLPLAAHFPFGLVPGNPPFPVNTFNPQFVGAHGLPAGAGQPGHVQPQQRRPVIRVRMFRINTATLLKYLFAFYVIYQYCPPQRFLLLVLVGFLLYLTTLSPLRRFLHRLVGVHNDNNDAGARRPAFLREVQALVMGFFTSLLPGWNYNPEDAAAFAAAQDIVAREAAQEGQNGDGGPREQPAQPAQQPEDAAQNAPRQDAPEAQQQQPPN